MGTPDDLEVCAFIAAHAEARFDFFAGKGQHFFHTQSEVLGAGMGVQPCFLGQERVDPIAGDNDLRAYVTVAIGAYSTHDAPAVVQQSSGGGGHHQRGPGRHCLLGKPAVEVRSVSREPVVWRLASRGGAIVDTQALMAGEQHGSTPGDPALGGHALPPIG